MFEQLTKTLLEQPLNTNIVKIKITLKEYLIIKLILNQREISLLLSRFESNNYIRNLLNQFISGFLIQDHFLCLHPEIY